MVVCPECEEGLALPAEPRAGEILDCAGCASELEILAVDPVLVALAPEIEEDWGE